MTHSFFRSTNRLIWGIALLASMSVGTSFGDTASGDLPPIPTPVVDSDSEFPAQAPLDTTAEDAPLPPLLDPEESPTPPLPPPRADSLPDTAFTVLSRPYWAIGAGWALGGMPLFSLWQGGLPDSLRKFNLETPIPRSVITGTPDDTGSVGIRHFNRELPSSYNVYFPLYFVFAPVVSENNILSIDASFFFVRKKFIAELQADSARYQVFFQEALTALWGSVGISYAWAIPEQYFSVADVNKTFLHLGLSVRPFQMLWKSPYIRTNGPDDPIRHRLEDAAQNLAHGFRANGLGLGWRAGISSIKRLSPTAAMDVGLFYTGDWAGAFSSSGTRLREGDLNPIKSGRAPSFVSHMLEIRILFLRGRR